MGVEGSISGIAGKEKNYRMKKCSLTGRMKVKYTVSILAAEKKTGD